MTRILVHIDKLVLRGFADADAGALADEISRAVANELGNHALDAPLITRLGSGALWPNSAVRWRRANTLAPAPLGFIAGKPLPSG